MRADKLRMEPTTLTLDKDVKDILKKGGFLNFLNKFNGFDRELSMELAHSWNEGKVKAKGIEFTINIALIAEVSGLEAKGECINREKHSLAKELKVFQGEGETLDKFLIHRESLPKPWDRVVLPIMHYFTLDPQSLVVRSFHMAFLNHLRRGKKMNIPGFLFKSIEKTMKEVQRGKYPVPLHQGLLRILFLHSKSLKGVTVKKEPGLRLNITERAKEELKSQRRSKRLKKSVEEEDGTSPLNVSDQNSEDSRESIHVSWKKKRPRAALPKKVEQCTAKKKSKVDPPKSQMGIKNTFLSLSDLINSMRRNSKMVALYADEAAFHLEDLKKKIAEWGSDAELEIPEGF